MSAEAWPDPDDDDVIPITQGVHAGRRRMAARQTAEALARAELPLSAYLAWPWADLDAGLGPMAPGEVHVVTGFSGNGKTTYVLSAIDAFARAGHHVLVLPLEIPAKDWRPMWACFRVGLRPKEVLQGHLKRRARDGDEFAARQRAEFLDELEALGQPPWSDRVVLSEDTALDADRLYDTLVHAGESGFRAVVIDHMDHVEGGKGNTYEGARAIARACLEGAQDGGVIVLATSQCNNDIVRGTDRLAQYQPPMPHHVLHGGAKREVCTTMLGLFRPLRVRQPHEAPRMDGARKVDPYVEAIKAARHGDVEPQTALMPGVTGVSVMKHRHDGSAEGRRLYLGYEAGRNVPLSELQRRDLEAAQHRIRTGSDT